MKRIFHISYVIPVRRREEKKKRDTEYRNSICVVCVYRRSFFYCARKRYCEFCDEIYRRARSDIALRLYSDDTRLAGAAPYDRLSIPRVRLIALNQISYADALRVTRLHTPPRMRVPVVKDFIVMNLIFIQTVPALPSSLSPLSLSHSLVLSPPSLSPISATLDEAGVSCQCGRGLQGTQRGTRVASSPAQRHIPAGYP